MTQPVKYAGWPKGMDNRRKEYDLPADTLRDAINVDVLNSGKVRMRNGPGTQIFAEANAHSVTGDGRKLLWATPSTLRSAPIGGTARTLLTDARLAKPLSWVTLHGKSYFSNEDVNGAVNILGGYEPWGIVPPVAAPTLTGDGGTRTVMVTCTFLAATVAIDGTTVFEESGAPAPVSVAVTDTALLRISAIPQSTDPRFAGTRLYVSGIGGTDLYKEVDLPPGVTAWTLRAPFGQGEALKVLLNSNPPAGQLLEYLNGAIYLATGNTLYHTEPLRYGMIDNDKKFFQFPERITMIKGVPATPAGPAGMFISAERTYFIENIGSPDARPLPRLDYRAIEGAAIHLPESDDVMWLSERGVVLGSTGGKVRNLTESQIAMDQYTRAVMGYFERDGHRAVAVVGQAAIHTALISSDWVADEAARQANIQ